MNIVQQFEAVASAIDSKNQDHNTNAVLEAVRLGLENIGFIVEKGKKQKIKFMSPSYTV